MAPGNHEQLKLLTDACVGSFIKHIAAGGGTGSILNIHVSSGHVLMVNAFWRLVIDHIVQASSESDSSLPAGLMITKLREVEERMILSFDLFGFDFKMRFSAGQTLEVYCATDASSEYEDWWIANPRENLCFEVSNGSVVRSTYS